MRKNQHKENNDWVLEFLNDGVRLQPSRNLWPEIRQRILQEKRRRRKTGLRFRKPHLAVDWAFLILFLFSMISGIWIGKSFSHHFQQPAQQEQLELDGEWDQYFSTVNNFNQDIPN